MKVSMSAIAKQGQLCPNRLLSKLAFKDFEPLRSKLVEVDLPVKTVLHRRGQPIPWVYFPCDSTLSNIIYLTDGSGVEVGTVGNEGFSGVEILVGATLATETTVCQIRGSALRMDAQDFRNSLGEASPLRSLANCYCQGYLTQLSQSVACNRRHALEERFARWLLISHDRAHKKEFLLTQEFIADMLGAHRPSVSIAAAGFQKLGFIRYSRGRITVLDRAGLERAACECYAVVRDEYARLMGLHYG